MAGSEEGAGVGEKENRNVSYRKIKEKAETEPNTQSGHHKGQAPHWQNQGAFPCTGKHMVNKG